jgi:hypothetical protein
MALSKTLELQDSFGENRTFENAYVKVTKLHGNKDMMQVVYTSFSAKDGNKLKDYQTGFSPSLDGSNFIQQAYEHLKTLDNLADAVDA